MTLVATATSRVRVATARPRVRVALRRPGQTSTQNRFTPPQDPGVESEVIGFDYGLILATGETISSVSSVTCTVDQGFDPSPTSRLSGGNMLTSSQKTGVVNGMVVTRFSGQLAGTTYKLQCVVVTSAGNTFSVTAYI